MHAENDAIRVLYVDEKQEWGEVSADLLDGLDENVTVVGETTPEAALDRLSTDAIDCIVSEYRLPQMHGVAFLRTVRETYPNLPFILFTNEGSEDVAAAATRAGVTAYLKKDGPDASQLLATQVERNVSHRRTERRARVGSDRLLALYGRTSDCYLLDDDWTVLYWSQGMVARTGCPADDVLGAHVRDVFPATVATELREKLQATKERDEPTAFDRYDDARDEWVEVRAYPVDEGLFVHSRDITADKTLEQELTNRNQILESFANTVSHDLRNPLSVAEGRLQLAQETGDFTHLDEVTRAHNRMRNLIDDLLQLAREEEPNTEIISLQRSAERAWETVSANGAELDVRDDARFEGYRSQLRRLFENLYWNAIDHGEATTVRVGTLDDGFYVEDDGRGIDAERRERVFDAGYSTSENGTGYGLHIVENIVRMHGWRISVTAGEDGGARFEIHGVSFIENGD